MEAALDLLGKRAQIAPRRHVQTRTVELSVL